MLKTSRNENIKIIESGSNTNGSWIKFEDGTMVCTRKVNVNCNISAVWGSLFYGYAYLGNDSEDVTFPFAKEFIDKPTVQISLDLNATASFGFLGGINNINKGWISSIPIIRPSQKNDWSGILHITAIGKWK